jgi:hypothetical protein
METRPLGISIFLNGSADIITPNRLNDSQTNALLVQRGSTVTEISENTVTNSGSGGLFVENNARLPRIVNNTSTRNSTCPACTDAKAGLAVLADPKKWEMFGLWSLVRIG